MTLRDFSVLKRITYQEIRKARKGKMKNET